MAGLSENKCDYEKINSNLKNKHLTSKDIGTDYNYKHEIVWQNIVFFSLLHLLGFWGVYIFFTGGISLKTYVWFGTVMTLLGFGITAGAHRLFTHKCYKAKTPLKALLIVLQTASGQNTLYTWIRDHRLHHRYSDTDGDPHNSKRGFFFSHIGWLLTKKHPYIKELGKRIDMSDIEADKLITFQRKYYFYIFAVSSVLIPVGVPYYFFGEPFLTSLLVCFFARYVVQLNGTWLVNSAAHLYGTRPYDKKLQPVESWFVSLFSYGEGWHNYHHAFPWDYKAAELPYFINPSTAFIDFFAKLGLAYDLKTASEEMVVNRIKGTGDGTHFDLGNDEAKSAVTATGIVHPLNITYNVTYPPPNTELDDEGLPLCESEVLERTSFKKRSAKA
ncbi:unnamed protein product [Colias eurytheme]|nr:unnamed protein product [Colias eurytheme]